MDNNDSLATQTDATSEHTDILTEVEAQGIEEQTEETPTPKKVPTKRRIRRAPALDGPKRQLKKVSDSMASIRKPSLRRLGRRNQIKRFTSSFFKQAKLSLKDQLEVFMRECYLVTEMNKRKTINNECVKYVFTKMRRPLYVTHH